MLPNSGFLRRIVLGECAYHVLGSGNTQYTCIQGVENSREIQKYELHSEK